MTDDKMIEAVAAKMYANHPQMPYATWDMVVEHCPPLADSIRHEAAGIIEVYESALRAVREGQTNIVTRHEVIDHRTNAPDIGRLNPQCVEFQYQDDGRTLKVFLKDVPATPPKE